MKSILLIALAAQLPFAATLPRFAAPPASAAASPNQAYDAQRLANDEALRQLEATTHSVMKRRGDRPVSNGWSAATGIEKAAAAHNEQVVQAAFNQPQNGAAQGTADNSAGDADTSSAAPDDENASRSGTAVDSATRAAANASAALLTEALAPRAENALEGRPVPLAEALGRVGNSAQRLEVASLYWRLALAIAEYHWALDESQQLDALPANRGAVDSPLLATARAAAQAKALEAKATVVTVQQELADAIGQPTQPLPLTVEQPLVGPYRTEFDTIFANRQAPGRSRAIHRGLPLRREAIDLRTAAVQAAASAVQTAEEAYASGNAAVETLLFAHRELSAERRAYLSSVREYNAEIVEYASYVAGPTTSTATLVSMLTRTRPNKVSASGAPATFAGANEPTPADPRFDPNVQPARGEE